MLLAIAEVDNEDNSKRGQDDEDSSTPILIFGAVGRPDVDLELKVEDLKPCPPLVPSRWLRATT